MNRLLARLSMGLALLSASVAALAGTLTVTSPTNGASLGAANTLRFNVVGAIGDVTVKAVVTGPGGSTTVSDSFAPDANGEISATLPLNFSSSSPEGPYTIVVSATEPNNEYQDVTLDVTVDLAAPKFEELSPNSGQFVKGIVPIRITVRETNVKDWTVQVNGQDVPNNTGTGNLIAVDLDTSRFPNDGPLSISVRVRDTANNTASRTISLTLDRAAPVVTIAYPRTGAPLIPGSMITVIVDVQDASSASMDFTGVDVIAKRLDGSYLARVVRLAFRPAGGGASRWIGRLRYVRGAMPRQIRIVATAVDRAGNVATPQEVVIGR